MFTEKLQNWMTRVSPFDFESVLSNSMLQISNILGDKVTLRKCLSP